MRRPELLCENIQQVYAGKGLGAPAQKVLEQFDNARKGPKTDYYTIQSDWD